MLLLSSRSLETRDLKVSLLLTLKLKRINRKLWLMNKVEVLRRELSKLKVSERNLIGRRQ